MLYKIIKMHSCEICNYLTTSNYNLKVHYKTMHKGDKVNVRVTQKDVDLILDKISKSGYESLSKREKEILFKASND